MLGACLRQAAKGKGSSSCCKMCLIQNSFASIRIAGLVNSQQIWAGFKEMGLTPQTQNKDWESAGLGARWGLDTAHVQFHRHFPEDEEFVDPRSQRKRNGGYPDEAKHTKGSWN